MLNYSVSHNHYGGIWEVRFKPSFQVDNQCFGKLGPQMMKHGNFQLEGWSWDEKTETIYKSCSQESNLNIEPKEEVEKIDDMITELLKQFTQWLSFKSIAKKIDESAT
jgi:hypothetical protein